MLVGMGIIICSFIYNLMVAVIYFSKKRITTETKIYNYLLIISLINLVIEFSLCIMVLFKIDMNSVLNLFLNRIFIIAIFAWVSIFTVYIFKVSFDKDQEYLTKMTLSDKSTKLLYKIFFVFVIVSLVCLMFLRIDQFLDANYSYSYGPAINMLYFVITTYIITWIVCIFLSIKKETFIKYLPVFSLILCCVIVLILRGVVPGILLNSFCLSFNSALMYFTIENPDVKMVNELNIAKDQADAANNSKTEFLSSMSHEIRTPLNAIVGFSQVLLNKDLTDESKEEVKDIIMASETLLGIVNGILDISKIEANKLEIINNEYSTHKMLNELISLTKARMGEKPLDFKTYFDPALPEYLYGDSSRIKQIILNLLTNSVKYTKEGFVDFKINTITKGGICRLIISVEDSGVGIKPDEINKLFKKFERLNEGGNTSIEGTGLGLAITQKLVELMNGKIFVQSVFTKGSKFTVVIDQKVINKVHTPLTPDNNNNDLIKTIDFSNKKVLVVDDNTLNLKVASRLLANYGLEVQTIDNGFTLIEKMKANEHYDLILLDDMMPKLSGTDTLKNLRNLPNFSIPTVVLTANAIEGMRDKYLSEGFDDYLAKPLDKSELNRVLIKYLYK